MFNDVLYFSEVVVVEQDVGVASGGGRGECGECVGSFSLVRRLRLWGHGVLGWR